MKTKKTHWLQSPNKNYLGHWDLPNGNPLTLTIDTAKWEEVKNPIINVSEAKRVVRFKEKVKPFICNQTNANSILKSTGVNFMEDSAGFKITLYVATIRDNKTKELIDCLRVQNAKVITEKEVLNPESPKWEKAKKAIQENKSSYDAITKHYQLSKENYDLLCG